MGVGGGGQGGYPVNQELKFFGKFKKKTNWGGGRGVHGGVPGLGGQGGCDRRLEKFLGKFTKKKIQGGVGWGGGSEWM